MAFSAYTRTLLASATVLAAACAGGAPSAPALEERVVVHAVLDPRNAEQVILVQRTQSGVGALATARAASDPMAGGGVPLSGARVVLFGPGTDSVVAVEDPAGRPEGGRGVYRVASRAVANAAAAAAPPQTLRLAPGARYVLRVDTPLGTVRGTTRMPRFNAVVDRAPRTFNLDADTLRRPRLAGDGSRPAGYLLRHLMAGAMNRERVLADTNDVLLAPSPTSDERTWSFGYSRRYIRPGVVQRFVAVAVDSNFYHYRASGYDPFGHDAKGSRLTGGVGLFGAVATVVDATLDLVAERDHAIEGEWLPTSPSAALPQALSLYESPRFPGPTGGSGLHLWGTARMPGGDVYLVDASFVGASLQLQLTQPGTGRVRAMAGSLGPTGLSLGFAGSATRVKYANRLAPGS